MNKSIIVILITVFLSGNLFAQEQLPHEPKVFVNPENKIFINKSQPIYFRVATSPDPNAPSYLMPSENTPQYSNPMYLDTEGRNTLRSPSAVDKKTMKTVLPKVDIQFEVYADGLAPLSSIKMEGSVPYIFKSKTYYGKSMKIRLKATDANSGVEKSYISVNGEAYSDFAGFTQQFDNEKEYTVKYYSVDNVGNTEIPKTFSFQMDLTPPTTAYKIIGENKGNVISSKASIGLVSTDTLSGVNKIWYSINEGAFVPYVSPIPILVLKNENAKITYYATDKVGNKEESKVIATFAGSMEEKSDLSSFSFYIDKDPPQIGFEIEGDQYKGKYLFISARSRFKVIANDDKSGVEKISYSIDNLALKNIYTEPFGFQSAGLHSVLYAAADYVGNAALVKTQQIFMDASIPSSTISYKGNTFTNRDTIFITKNTSIQLKAAESGSGLNAINYKIDNESSISYQNPISIENEGFHSISFQAMDNVNNMEEWKKAEFIVDNTPPQIITNFSIKPIGEKTVRNENYVIYPSNVMMYIAATDNASGSDKIEYRINGTGLWLNTIPIKGLVPGNYEIEVISQDVLKNKSVKIERFAIEN